ncbi:MAG: Ldh family oxidoreductase [Burkholderiales bacterium]|nr:Ldh family oxidoreductase [Burkholderiales bacterium]
MALYLAEELLVLAARALTLAGASSAAAEATARALIAADEQGISSHGLAHLPLYVAHLRNGRVRGDVVPVIVRKKAAAILIDAQQGMAYEACALAIRECIARAAANGVAYAAVTNSNHNGMTSYHLEPVADAGMVGIAFGNSPGAINAWGGKRPLFGTNPVAAIFPRRYTDPVVIDLSLSEVARGKVLVAAREGKAIPEGWALDKEGNPTTDPKAGMEGSMVPMGGGTGSAKGSMLVLTIELLSVALTGAAFGFENESFFNESGSMVRLGQGFLVIDPAALAGREIFLDRMETIAAAMLEDDAVRLPGQRRIALREIARRDGVDIPDALYKQLRTLAEPTGTPA